MVSSTRGFSRARGDHVAPVPGLVVFCVPMFRASTPIDPFLGKDVVSDLGRMSVSRDVGHEEGLRARGKWGGGWGVKVAMFCAGNSGPCSQRSCART